MYWRLRGARAQNAHKKMSNMLHLILNLMLRYSANSGTARCGEHDFGHPWLFYVDRIQDRIEKTWNVTVFSSHTSILAFKPTYVVVVGIGPLSYDSTCVQVGEPMPHLTGDMLFLAQRMKLKCPPIPCSTKEEIKIYNAFLRAHPKPNERQWRELESQFLHKMYGINVFPKLPQMLKSRFDRWSVNQDIKILGERIKDGFNHMIKKLFMARTNAPQPLDGGTVAAATSQRIQPNSTLAPVGFVPPITAPFQTSEIIAPVASGGSARRCAFWPACNNDAASCGGHTQSTCKYYGIIGPQSDKRPSTKQINEARKKDKQQIRIDRSCAFYLICTEVQPNVMAFVGNSAQCMARMVLFLLLQMTKWIEQEEFFGQRKRRQLEGITPLREVKLNKPCD
jgi:hypothetical protein